VEYRQKQIKDRQTAAKLKKMDQLFGAAHLKELNVIIKGDVQGSVEAISASLLKLATDEVTIRVVHSGVGGITESDMILAKATGAIIIGFNVRANNQAKVLADRDKIDVRYYSIIYNVVDDVKAALSGLLSPVMKENILGYVEIRQVFNITKVGKVAGCMVTDGLVRRNAKVRLLRDNVVIHEGTLSTLKRFKEDVREVKAGFECGIAFENYDDIREGDTVEAFEVEEIARTI
jgi:translation initiation factor IF-2